MITLIVGLPGSGKSHLANQLVKDTEALLFDDITETDLHSLYEALDHDKDCIVVHPNFCYPDVLLSAISKLCEHISIENVKIICFENDLETALHNVKYRNDGRVVHSQWIKELSRIYIIPNNIQGLKIPPEIRPIHRIEISENTEEING